MNCIAPSHRYACYTLLLTSPSGKRFLQIGASPAPLEAIRSAKSLGYRVLTLSITEAGMSRSEALLNRDQAWMLLDNWPYQPEQLIEGEMRCFEANAHTAFLLQRQGVLKPASAQVILHAGDSQKQPPLAAPFIPRRIQLRPTCWWSVIAKNDSQAVAQAR